MTVPDFFVIGAYKSGTTALQYMLRRHDDIFLHHAVKETNFFAPDVRAGFRIRDRSRYEDLFHLARADQKVGEVCPSYLFSSVAADLIRREAPGAKLVAILRDPADRAFSDFMMHVRGGRRSVADFQPQIEREIRGQLSPDDRPVLPQGLYVNQLQRFWDAFPQSNLKIILYDDLRQSPLEVVNYILEFVGVGKMERIDEGEIYNVSGKPRSVAVQHLINLLRARRRTIKRVIPEFVSTRAMRIANRNLQRVRMTAHVRCLLVSYYGPEIRALQSKIDRDLSSWLSC